MICHNPECMGNYDFEKIAFYAKKRFIEGHKTIELMQAAKSDLEKEEIALVSFLDLEDERILQLQLNCKYADECISISCRDKLKKMIEQELSK